MDKFQKTYNLEEIDNFLETYSLPKLNWEKTDNLNRLITSKIELVKNKTKTKTTLCKQKSRTRWLHWGILPNIQRRTYTYPSQTISKNWRGGNTPKFIRWSHHHPDTKTRQRHYKKRKLQANTFMTIDAKILNKISKPSPTMHGKHHTPWSSWIHSRDARMVQHIQINQCTPH